MDLGEDVSQHDGLWLLAYGSVYPTDSSINVAMGQGGHPLPQGISVELQDESGSWTVGHEDLGFPAGKNKTMVIEIDPLPSGVLPRRVRLRTNLEVYWDWIGYAPKVAETKLEITQLTAETATLRHRGYSRTNLQGPRGLEIPEYEIGNIRPRWRDLIGFYTRFGDVNELLTDVDDRYVLSLIHI